MTLLEFGERVGAVGRMVHVYMTEALKHELDGMTDKRPVVDDEDARETMQHGDPSKMEVKR